MFQHSLHHPSSNHPKTEGKYGQQIKAKPCFKTFGNSHVGNVDERKNNERKPKYLHDLIVRLHVLFINACFYIIDKGRIKITIRFRSLSV